MVRTGNRFIRRTTELVLRAPNSWNAWNILIHHQLCAFRIALCVCGFFYPAKDGHQVMFTHGEHVDVFDYHHLIVVFIEDGVVQYVWGEKWERLNIKEKSFCLNLTVTWIFCSIPCLVDWLFTFCDHADLFCRSLFRGFLLLFGLNFKKLK